MTDTLICDLKEDTQNKQSSSFVSPFLVSRFGKSDSLDSSSTRKLRILMNKVTENNFQKLLDELLENQTFDEKLINEFLKLVFDRASNKSSPDLFVDVLTYFSHRLKILDSNNFGTLKKSIKAKVQGSGLCQPTVGWVKFVGYLYKEKLISHKTISKLLTPAESETTSEKFIENFCALLEVASPYLVISFEDYLENSFGFLSEVQIENYSKKIQYLVIGILEQKKKLMTPAPAYTPRFSDLMVTGRGGKKVSFSDIQDFIPVLSSKAKRILKHTVSEESKQTLKAYVAEYVKGKKDLKSLKSLFEDCKNQERQLVYQIFKYALIQFSREQEFNVICELLSEAVEKFLNKCVIETGVANTVEAIEDIKLDTPMAAGYLRLMIENLKEKGIIENPQYLFDHLTRPEEGKFLEGVDYTY